ncbi:Sugar phosphate permease [Mesorhizobium albiziae]|uniref:Sugar phosphate permease n=1 Tax=Neomesorhizobium albiziae TaxID=335020 RepID=A0A1I3V1J3_9HYPH|nr:MFS transporter [Mesorhizobium albiziae]GLS28556.1 MFS transporter [Mesorhizobium albiziae]SFJ88236.1 Sugar phosphate permease [Mesorhizobium albiziae]
MAGIAVLAIAYVLSQFYRSFMAVLTPALIVELGATNADLSLASGAFFISFALSQFAIGVSLDRYGPRRTAAILLAAGGGGGAFLFAAAEQPWMITAAMVLIGIGCAPVLMAALFIFARIFSKARFAVLTSWLVAFGAAGNVIGASPLANAAEAFGWRPVMAGLGLFTLLTAAAVLALVRDPARPEGMPTGSAGFSGFVELLRMRVLWPIIPLIAINYAPPAGIRGLWAGPYLSEVYGAGTLVIGEVTLLMALAMVVGSFVYGPLDTFLKTRKWVGLIGNSISLAAICFLAVFTVSSISATTAALVVIGLCGMSYGLMMAHARAFFPPHLVGRGVTLMNFFTIGGVGAMQFATGAVVTANAVPGEPAAAYTALFTFYAVMLGIALAIYLFSRDAKPERT